MQEFIEKERMVDAHTPSPPSTSAKKKSVQDAQNEYVKVLKYGFAATLLDIFQNGPSLRLKQDLKILQKDMQSMAFFDNKS